MSKTTVSASATGLPFPCANEGSRTLRLHLTQIQYSLDALTAAVRGSEFNDLSQQRGIIHLMGELYCELGEVIDEMGGKEDVRDAE